MCRVSPLAQLQPKAPGPIGACALGACLLSPCFTGAPSSRPGADSPGPPGSPLPLPPAAHLHQLEPLSPPPRRCAEPSPSPASGAFRSASWPQPPAPERTAISGPPNRGRSWTQEGAVGSQSIANPQTVASQAPLSMEFTRQEYWSPPSTVTRPWQHVDAIKEALSLLNQSSEPDAGMVSHSLDQ